MQALIQLDNISENCMTWKTGNRQTKQRRPFFFDRVQPHVTGDAMLGNEIFAHGTHIVTATNTSALQVVATGNRSGSNVVGISAERFHDGVEVGSMWGPELQVSDILLQGYLNFYLYIFVWYTDAD